MMMILSIVAHIQLGLRALKRKYIWCDFHLVDEKVNILIYIYRDEDKCVGDLQFYIISVQLMPTTIYIY